MAGSAKMGVQQTPQGDNMKLYNLLNSFGTGWNHRNRNMAEIMVLIFLLLIQSHFGKNTGLGH